MQFSFSLQMKFLTDIYSELLSDELKKASHEFMEWQRRLKENAKEGEHVHDWLIGYSASAKCLAEKYEAFRADVKEEECLEGYIITFDGLVLPILTKVTQAIERFIHDGQKDAETEKLLARFVFENDEA